MSTWGIVMTEQRDGQPYEYTCLYTHIQARSKTLCFPCYTDSGKQVTTAVEAAVWQQALMRRPGHCCLSFGACSRVQADGAVLLLHTTRPYNVALVLHWSALLPPGAISAPESIAGKARQQGLPLLGRFLQMQLCSARCRHMRSRAM